MKYRNEILELYGGRCYHCEMYNDIQIHHKLSNSQINQDRFPLFIGSVFNLIPMCGGFSKNNCHQNKKHLYKINEREATLYEEFLQSLLEAGKQLAIKEMLEWNAKRG